MYSSLFIMQTLISLLLFHLQDTCTATDHSVLMGLRAQRGTLVDSPLFDAFLSLENHQTLEDVSKYELITPSSSRNILMDKTDPGPEQSQKSWLGQHPVDTLLLTLCSTNTEDETDLQSLLPPSAKFHRRQTTRVPKVCPPEWITLPPDQQNLKIDVQGQRSRKKIPERSRPAAEAEEQKVDPYPNALELFQLDRFGRAGNSHSICDVFVGQSIPMCAPSSLLIPVSPPNMLAPSRFCECDSFISRLPFLPLGIFLFPPTPHDGNGRNQSGLA